MPRTPETLVRHELVGTTVTVVAAANPDLIGIEGEVVAETTNTLHVEDGARAWQVPKATATLVFELDDGQQEADDASERASGESRERVRVEGERLVSRPARRTEQTGDSQWR
ncbi:ribonuclease P [Halapricum sp. CBA1109]|jgi:ribonuclease P protein subunit POP4|uniref:ribonuclease P protein component 1 n=1 Tax=Halapricum sp. CBA1109 TaxID=2668068 RepID=UPI0012F8BE3C|nr:ribonuclease P protein component 1 [Halapricum sp. CBA1109]MUV89032.1 ribonuclease P [Halapricum sp. CBA1109]